MNVLLFLIPKDDVAYEFNNHTLRNLVEKMDAHNLTAIPIINNKGKYVMTISEGDVLRYLKNNDLNLKKCEDVKISELNPRRDIKAVKIDCETSEIYKQAMNQDFLPVIDDSGTFIGIVTRSRIINHLLSKIK